MHNRTGIKKPNLFCKNSDQATLGLGLVTHP